MDLRSAIFVTALLVTAHAANAQRGEDFVSPMPSRTAETDEEALRLMRNDKLDLVLPGAMRDNDVDMWIHVTRGQDPMAIQFGRTSGYLETSDVGSPGICPRPHSPSLPGPNSGRSDAVSENPMIEILALFATIAMNRFGRFDNGVASLDKRKGFKTALICFILTQPCATG